MCGKTRTLTWAIGLAIAGGASVLGQSFRAHSDLVVLQVSVHDKDAEPVSNLTRDDFRIMEDGVRQDIQFFVSEDQPVAIGLIVDNSGSMEPKRREVIEAAEAFARGSNPADAIFVVNFNETVSLALPEGVPFTSDLAVLHDALGTIAARGQTALFDGIGVGLVHVNESPLDRKVLVVVSDGDDNRSRLTMEDVFGRAMRSSAAIYTVGVFDKIEGGNKKVLEKLAEGTGGLAFFPETIPDIRRVLNQICLDVRHRYTLGYVPSNTAVDGRFRRVRVDAVDREHRRSLRVHARTGYFAANPVSGR
jgi:VWFA-related protein